MKDGDKITVGEYRKSLYFNPEWLSKHGETAPNTTTVFVETPESSELRRLCERKGISLEDLIETLKSLPNRGVIR